MSRQNKIEKATAQLITQSVVQLLFSTCKAFTVDGLREKLRELYKTEANATTRAAAGVSNIELITILLDANKTLAQVGLVLVFTNGVVSLHTASPHQRLADYLRSIGKPRVSGITPPMLDVLSVVAHRQPVSQAEIDMHFDADKRYLVSQLLERNLIESHPGTNGRLHFSLTLTFLQQFGFTSFDQLRAVLASPPRIPSGEDDNTCGFLNPA